MTRQDYQLIAAALREAQPGIHQTSFPGRRAAWHETVVHVTKALEADAVRRGTSFDANRFVAATGALSDYPGRRVRTVKKTNPKRDIEVARVDPSPEARRYAAERGMAPE
jgi:hypothetical protein